MSLYGALEVPWPPVTGIFDFVIWPPVTGIFDFVMAIALDRGVETRNEALVAAVTWRPPVDRAAVESFTVTEAPIANDRLGAKLKTVSSSDQLVLPATARPLARTVSADSVGFSSIAMVKRSEIGWLVS